MAVGMMAALGLVMVVLWSCTGCAAVQPYARVDQVGYEVGVAGTWLGVTSEVQRMTGGTDGKEAVQ
jgi:hypothetical protein